MKHPLSLLHERRADSHRAMAIAALRSKSSLNVRRDRYNRHMDKARAAQALARQYQKAPLADQGDARTTALSLIEPRLNAWRDDPEPAEGRELIGLICMASALGAIDLDDQARIVTQFQPSQPEARHA